MTDPENFRIEPASEKDLPLILSFVRELAEYEKLADTVTANEERLRRALFGAEPFAKAIIAYLNKQPVAFALYFFNFSSFSALPGLYLEDIFVKPHARGLGIGTRLFRWLAQEAIDSGCGRMEWAVLDWNTSSIGFYENLGAEAVVGWTVMRLNQENLLALAPLKTK